MTNSAHNFSRTGKIQNWRSDRGYGAIKDSQTGAYHLATLAGNKGKAFPSGSSLVGTVVRFQVKSAHQPVDWISATEIESEKPQVAPVQTPVPVRPVSTCNSSAIPQPRLTSLAVNYVQAPISPTPILRFELWTAYYHITHYKNLLGIFKHGILSWNTAHANGVTETDISDPSVQQRRRRCEPIYNRSVHDYVPLYFNPKNAMLSRRKDLQHELVILKVSKDVLLEYEHLFTDGNAASANTKFSTDYSVVEPSKTALQSNYWAGEMDGKRRRCAVVLVFPTVEPRFIVSAICNSQTLVSTIQSMCPVPAVIDSTVFY